ncbi:MAG: M23 family metallopeptidase [Bacteriovoracaceae bacterium]
MLILVSFLFSFQLLAKTHVAACEVKNYQPAYLKLAWGKLTNKRSMERSPWPLPLLSIGHNMASYQNYGGGLDQAYFHHGLDIRADKGTPIHAAKGGKVVNAANYNGGNSLYWEVAILDDNGFIWQYHHIDSSSIPDAVKKAFKAGGRVSTGDLLGEVVSWPITSYGERYHHIHLNILDKDKAYVNPFHFLDVLPDTKAPMILDIGFVRKNKIVAGDHITGAYNLYLHTQDLILHDKFFVPPYEISYRINQGETVTVWKFDNLPGGAVEEKFVNDFFIPNLTCGDYSCRKMYINLGFTVNGNRNFPQTKGVYDLEVTVKDVVGNQDIKIFHFNVD